MLAAFVVRASLDAFPELSDRAPPTATPSATVTALFEEGGMAASCDDDFDNDDDGDNESPREEKPLLL